MLILHSNYAVPKSDEYPSQAVIDAFIVPLCISARTPYRSDDERVLAVRYFQEIQKRLKEGQSQDHVYARRHRIAYEINKQWHEERYVVCSIVVAHADVLCVIAEDMSSGPSISISLSRRTTRLALDVAQLAYDLDAFTHFPIAPVDHRSC